MSVMLDTTTDTYLVSARITDKRRMAEHKALHLKSTHLTRTASQVVVALNNMDHDKCSIWART